MTDKRGKTAAALLMLLAMLAWTGPGHAQALFDDFSGPLSSTWSVIGSGQSIGRTQFGSAPAMRRDADGTTYAQLRIDTYNPNAAFRGRQVRGVEMYTNQYWSLPASGTGGIEFEARVRAKNLPAGLVGAFFTYGYRGTYPDTYAADEVDFETLTKLGTNQVWLNIFDDWRPSPYTPGPNRSSINTVSGLNWSDWTVYKVRWFRDRMEWLVNGVVARTEPNPAVGTPILPTDPMGVRFNFWMPDGGWTDAYSAGVGPTSDPAANITYYYDIDYLRVRSVTSPSTAPDSPPPSPTPVTIPPPVVGTGNGLAATYYDNKDFTGTSISRVDPNINFDWGAGSPNAAIGVDTWSARWTGSIQAQYTDTYTFHTLADDGIRVFINGRLVINNFQDQAVTETSGSIALKAGVKYDLRVEYYDNTGDALAQLNWSSLATGRTAVPMTQLYSSPLTTVATPTFSPDGGSFYSNQAGATQNVVVSCATAGAVIRYTKNGVDPTENDPIISSGASVSVSSGQTLKARAWKDNSAPSAVKSATYTIVIDTQAPSIVVTAPVENYSYTNLASATGTTTDAGPSGVAQVMGRLQRVSDGFFWNGTGWTSTEVETAATGTATWTWAMPTLADGKYSFRATARDRAGNAVSSPVINFYRDTIAPTVTIYNPIANARYVSLAQADGTAVDAGPGVAQVTGRLQRFSDNAYWSGTDWKATATEVPATGTGYWTWRMPALVIGRYAFRASASDFVGNVGTSPTVEFSISIPALSTFTLNPTTIRGGQSTTGTITLDAAAGAGGVSIALSSNDASAVTFPQTVVIPEGKTSATVNISAASRQTSKTVTLTATYNGTTLTANLTITPGSAWNASDVSLPLSGDSTPRLLWKNANGQIALWTVSPSGAMQNNWTYGPYDDTQGRGIEVYLRHPGTQEHKVVVLLRR
jgi:hypothetical protein